MRVFAVGIEHPLDVPIQRPHDSDAGEKHPSAFPLRRLCQHLRRRQNVRHVPLCLGNGFGEV